MTTFLRTALIALTLTGSLAHASATTAVIAPATDEDAAYNAGTKAMNESRWQDAVSSFDAVINARGKKVDAALYWKAYALNKLGNAPLAVVTCDALHTQFRTSDWNRDCAALNLNAAISSYTKIATANGLAHAGAGDPYHFNFNYDFDSSSHSKDPDTDIKILALNSLTHRDPAQAMPILRDILTGNQPPELKNHALFILMQSKSPEANGMIHDLIVGKQGPELQRQAIQASALYKGKQNNDALVGVYRTTNDPLVRKAILSSLFISNDDVHMVALAHSEKDLQSMRSIVSMLSLMKGKAAEDYMMELLK